MNKTGRFIVYSPDFYRKREWKTFAKGVFHSLFYRVAEASEQFCKQNHRYEDRCHVSYYKE